MMGRFNLMVGMDLGGMGRFGMGGMGGSRRYEPYGHPA